MPAAPLLHLAHPRHQHQERLPPQTLTSKQQLLAFLAESGSQLLEFLQPLFVISEILARFFQVFEALKLHAVIGSLAKHFPLSVSLNFG